MTKPLTGRNRMKLVAGLNKLARNLWWCWDQEAQDLVFTDSRRAAGRNIYHNSVAILREVSEYDLPRALAGPRLSPTASARPARFRRLSGATKHLRAANTPRRCTKSGGVFFRGVRLPRNAARSRRAASAFWPATMPNPPATSTSVLSGISLFYREGYFQQAIDANNWQTEYYTLLNPQNLPIEPVLDAKGEPLVVHAWRSA